MTLRFKRSLDAELGFWGLSGFLCCRLGVCFKLSNIRARTITYIILGVPYCDCCIINPPNPII